MQATLSAGAVGEDNGGKPPRLTAKVRIFTVKSLLNVMQQYESLYAVYSCIIRYVIRCLQQTMIALRHFKLSK